MKKTNKNEQIIAVLFVIYVFILCFSWAISTRFNSAPDEKMKYDICEYISENLKLPHGGDESIRDSKWGISYAFTPILSYMCSVVFMRIFMIFTNNQNILIIAARLVSVLCITGYAIMCIKIANELFKGLYKWLFVALVTLLPQLVYLGSYINNDSLALLSISIIVYSWILGLKNNWNWKSCIIMAIGIGICSLSYYNAYGYILCSVIIYILSCIIKKINWKEFIKKGIVIAVIAFIVAGWWFIRNYILYDGDFLGLNISREYGEMYAIDSLKPSNRLTPSHKKVSLSYMLINMNWLKSTINSFIGQFGYMTLIMNKIIYLEYKIFILIGVIGIVTKAIINLFKNIISKKQIKLVEETNKKEIVLFNSIMIVNIIIPILLSLYYSYFLDFQAQGRYIMPILIPFMYFIVYGFKNIFDKFIKKEKVSILLKIIIVIWSIMPIYIYFKYIIML